ncbi:62c7105a-8c59-4cc4-aeef-24b8e3c826eb [Sclerotinia trifoliorum]|uniref:62c7105a-8c59-4cc4-aeef-24b8e3c826eb n=1 Tax=Sclerotinia trifoliorum TaxID=28548 RepID=A0A8H2W484_9HELO|nr:62c7105a-8c59-4cc4-aeef-24b8e3c826eb [Sclerotinia trifoliorum]
MIRRPHTKSRSGCHNCKKRRIKCDEEKPSCQKCTSREVVCTYPRLRPLIWVDGIPSTTEAGKEGLKDSNDSSPPSHSSTPRNEEISNTKTPSLNLENIDLIIHWFTKTVHTVNPTSNPAALKTAQTLILSEAMQHHFLLHGLLALSALHYAESHANPQKYIEIATAHHTQGLNLYHSALSNMSKQNDTACIAFSSITAMFAFGVSRPNSMKLVSTELIDDFAQVFDLCRGWRTIMNVRRPLKFPLAEVTDVTLSTDAEAAFDRLYASNQGQMTTIYEQAISSLKAAFKKMEGENDNPHLALEWGNVVSEEFVNLIKARDRFALVIVGFYCVIFNKVPQVWWINGWSRALFDVVWREVDHSYHEVLEWPRAAAGFEI